MRNTINMPVQEYYKQDGVENTISRLVYGSSFAGLCGEYHKPAGVGNTINMLV